MSLFSFIAFDIDFRLWYLEIQPSIKNIFHSFQLTDTNAKMTIKDSKRSDTGPHKITLKNRFGLDSAKFNVKVLDRPGKPEGPIKPTEIVADAMTLHWNPPKDNGGDEITNYVVEKKDPNTGEWVRVSYRVTGRITDRLTEYVSSCFTLLINSLRPTFRSAPQ